MKLNALDRLPEISVFNTLTHLILNSEKLERCQLQKSIVFEGLTK